MAAQLLEWSLKESIKLAAKWTHATEPMQISINLTQDQLADKKFALQLETLCKDYGTDKNNILLEIEEPTAAHSSSKNTIEALANFGWTLVIDRFDLQSFNLDTLYASPFKHVKIHQKYILGLNNDPKAEFITQELAKIGHDFGLSVTAVGIENNDTWQKISHYGCDVGQGFYISQPIPAATFERWFQEA